jgi:hypothetical protein
MGYTNKTTKFQLPQFIKTDKPQMTDFNDAFKNIENKALSKSGDSMNGDLSIGKLYPTITLNDSGGKGAQTFIQNANHITWLTTRNNIGDNGNYRGIIVGDSEGYTNLKNAAKAVEKTNGGAVQYYNLYGEHNKPIGTYTGNGSAASRTIDTGGIGHVALIFTANNMWVVNKFNAVLFHIAGESMRYYSGDELQFIDGKIIMAVADDRMNVSGAVYAYQVL